jgi:hypothetical protein
MSTVEKKVTNFVVVVDFNPDNNYLEDQYLLGWNNKYDWFDCDTCGFEILTPTSRVKKNKFGLIDIDRWVSVYVGEEQKDCRSYSDDGNEEGYNCTVCRLEIDSSGEWIVIPV